MIKNNIQVVIDRLERYKKGVESAVRRAIAPERWFAELKNVAEAALVGGAGADEVWAVPKFLELMGSAFLGNRSEWWMGAPEYNASEALSAALDTTKRLAGQDQIPTRLNQGGGFYVQLQPVGGAAAGTLQGSELDLLDKMSVDDAMQLIKEWIEEGGKDLSEEDQALRQRPGKYDNQLVERVWEVFGIHPEYGRGNISDEQEDAIKKLTPHIVEFFSGKTAQGLDAATVDLWLRLVLAAWTAHFVAALPGVIDEELKKEWSGRI